MKPQLGPVGIWDMRFRGRSGPDAVAEALDAGWNTLWVPGLDGGGALDDVRKVLEAAPDSQVVTGVLNIWAQSAQELSELDEPRLTVGLGIGSPAGATARGRDYGSPIASMSAYLDEVAIPADRLLLGALGPRMVDLAVRRTAGWHPFLVTPEYVAAERQRVGEAPFLAPHQAVVLDQDPDRARATARAGIGAFIGFPTYRANLRRLGFDDDDLVPGGSDRLIDALVVHGTTDDVVRRVRAHHDAGADHVALHVLTALDSSRGIAAAFN
ncbi:TIGR03620 family F420-dependent LLM class oxidoreductase [Cryptosporangium phraense]|uniref:TIGR03620 family F420-dependent LLM class oxidoreductase n=1 Tax=Cryptosporangium phraense TaxID=2593070 RepID=A0A545AFN6_9ACTN|nr:TIGR03620 family F420-dependent LLM class oxidoreductase [Cryptosporangium phraense]TQS40133.1 TIGR03620 family F420-dependent LLM class oxidoreductase [Cryptosporangium phraense]